MSELISSKSILNILTRKKLVFCHENLSDAAVLLAITNESEPKILLTRRADHMSHHAGEVSLPGGRSEESDETNQEVVLRELFEELGLQSEYICFIGELPVQMSLAGLSVTPLVALIPPDLKFTPNPDEVSEVFYIPLNYFLVQETQEYIAQYPQGQVLVSSIHFKGEIIWGLTARIILSLFEITLNYKKDWIFYSKDIA